MLHTQTDQPLLYQDIVPPRISRRYSGALGVLKFIPTNKAASVQTTTSPWLPGERDRYRPVCPPGTVDSCTITATEFETDFRHSAWRARRQKMMEAMIRCKTPAKRMERFKNCGGGAWVYQSPNKDECRVVSAHCGDRLCSVCGSERGRMIRTAILDIAQGKEIRFITLTLKHAQIPLCDQVHRIYRCFTNLRRQKIWKKNVVGGAAFLELKKGKDGAWHVHLHCLVEGIFFSHRELSAAWLVATGDSYIVDIRSCDATGKVAGYVAKYAAKPIDSITAADPDMLDEAITALRGRRLCFTFDSWRGLPLCPPKPTNEGWQALGRLEAIVEAARNGMEWAKTVIIQLERKEVANVRSDTVPP